MVNHGRRARRSKLYVGVTYGEYIVYLCHDIYYLTIIKLRFNTLQYPVPSHDCFGVTSH